MRRIIAVAAAALTVMVLAMPAHAAKPPKPDQTRSASITLDQADPHLYDWVTFTLSYEGRGPDRVADPLILVACHQPVEQAAQGPMVWGSRGPEGAMFKLGGAWSSSFWSLSDGPAYCVASLYSIEDHGATSSLVAESTFVAQGSRTT